MIPRKIADFIGELINRTENGVYTWVYRDIESSASLQLNSPKLRVYIRYRFDEVNECGRFFLNITINDDDYFFDANEYENDYRLLKNLFDTAQASSFNFNFNNF